MIIREMNNIKHITPADNFLKTVDGWVDVYTEMGPPFGKRKEGGVSLSRAPSGSIVYRHASGY